jgi:3'(2'),5'-bisphosphate nucleotidase
VGIWKLAAVTQSFRQDAVKSPPVSDSELAEVLIAAALEAGRAILDVRKRGLAVERKADSSPVTEADRVAERIVLARIAALAPGVPVVAEEACSLGHFPSVGREFFLVDPLDGTKEFVRGGNDFTVNIALIREHAPVLGVIFTPATGELCCGIEGQGAWMATLARDGSLTTRRPMHVRPQPSGPIDVVASKSHRTPETDAYIARYRVRHIVSAGSSLKFCLIARGKADLYPRMGTTMQWDTAAGDAILRAAGGKTVTLDGAPLRYGPDGGAGGEAYRNPWFIAAGRTELAK